MERYQSFAFWLTLALAAIGLVAALGVRPLIGAPAWLGLALHPVVIAWGTLGGVLTVLRSREIDRERWEIANDSDITSKERALAHSEAENQMRKAGTVFLLASVAFGGAIAYHLRSEEGAFVWSDLLVVTPVFGFLAGMAWGSRRWPMQH